MPTTGGTNETDPGVRPLSGGITGGSLEYTTLRLSIPLFLISWRITFASGQTDVSYMSASFINDERGIETNYRAIDGAMNMIRYSLKMDEEELLQKANQWEISHGGKTPRAAMQLINSLK